MEPFSTFDLPSSQQIPKLQIPIGALGWWGKNSSEWQQKTPCLSKK